MDKVRVLHEKAADTAVSAAKHRRFGLWLFGTYLLTYAGFIGLAAFERETLAKQSWLRVNLAVLYGFGLIGFAFLLALVFLLAGREREGS